MLAAMIAPCLVKAQGQCRLPPCELVAICDRFRTFTALSWLCIEFIADCDELDELILSPAVSWPWAQIVTTSTEVATALL
jgi:hypothetical protein